MVHLRLNQKDSQMCSVFTYSSARACDQDGRDQWGIESFEYHNILYYRLAMALRGLTYRHGLSDGTVLRMETLLFTVD